MQLREVENIKGFWSTGVSGNVNKPQYYASAQTGTKAKDTHIAYGDSLEEAVKNLCELLDTE